MRLQPLEPRRVRRPRGAWGWVDLRVVTQGYLEKVGTAASLLYLFLCTVGDTAGLSFWSRTRIGRILGLDDEMIQVAFDKLVAADLIARQGQVVQVLPLRDVTATATLAHRPSARSSAGSDQQATCTGSSQSLLLPEVDQPTEVTEQDTEAYLPQARAQMARFLGHKAPSETALVALARSLAIKAGRARCG